MVTGFGQDAAQDPQLDEAIFAYLQAVEANPQVDRQEWLSRYPELAAELSGFFADQDEVDRLAAPLRAVAQAAWTTPSPQGTQLLLQKSPEATPWPEGSVRSFGDYELLQEVGRGGMGVVYKARQKNPNRLVALKMFRDRALATPADVQRFRAEAEAVASLDHAQILPIHEVGELDGQPYFTMKWVKGGSLAEHLGSFRAAPRAAAQLLVLVARGVHHAHQRGVLHRDLKPSNILLGVGSDPSPACAPAASAEPFVTDFGLAKRLQEGASLTETGAIVGTPSYMAPEQAVGKKGTITTATDIYGLGAVLYALLTERPPFQGETLLDTLTQVKEREPQPPSALNGGVDCELETICLKCLEKEPERRYASAEALARDLERWLGGEPIHARPIWRSGRLWRWCKRNRAVAALSALTCLLLSAGLIGLLVSHLLIVQEQEQTRTALGQAQEQRSRAEKRELEVRRQLYVADINRAAKSWGIVDTRQVLALLERNIPTPGQEDLRGFEWYYLQRLYQGQKKPRLTLQEGAGDVYCAVFSPDGQTLASCGHDGYVRLWNPGTGALQAKFRAHADEINFLAFSPDGQTLATASDDRTVKLWDRASGQELRQITRAAKPVVGVAFSPDGKMLAAGLDEGTLLRWQLPSGRPLPPIRAHSRRIQHVAFSPDGARLATAGDDGAARVWQAASGRLENELREFSTNKAAIKGLAFARHHPWLATADGDGLVALWSTKTVRTFLLLRGHRAGTEAVALSPDDRLLASASADTTVRLWEMPSGKLCNLFTGHTARVWCATFSPDGRTLATASRDGTVKLWDPEVRQDYRVLQADWRTVSHLAFAPDSQILATSSWDGKLRFWDVASGQLQGQFERTVTALAFSPDGKTFAFGEPKSLVRLWDMSRREEVLSFEGGEGNITDLGFSRAGDRLLTRGFTKGPAKVWQVGPGRRTTLLASLAAGDGRAALSPEGNVVAITRAGGVQFWELPGGVLRQGLSQSPTNHSCPAFSPDGRLLATPGSVISLWDVATGRLATTTGFGRGEYSAVAFSPDGKTLAGCAREGAVILWNVATGQELLTLERANCRFWSVAFSPDGRTLATGGEMPPHQPGVCQLWFTVGKPRPPQQREAK